MQAVEAERLPRQGRWRPVVLFVFLTFAGLSPAASAAPAVVVTIKPLHSLVAFVLRDVASPALLIPAAGSPHGFALRPSQARELQEADAIFWVGPGLERFLVRPLETLPRRARIVALLPAVSGIPYRAGAVWSGKSEGHDGHAHGHRHDDDRTDPHFWLDPVRAKAVIPEIVRVLAEIDGANAARYEANGKALANGLDRLHARIDATLAPVRDVPYLVFHDAYQYLEARYRLTAVGAVALDPEIPPGARHLAGIRRRAVQGGVRCLFGEPQFSPSLLKTVARESAVRVATLDPLGVSIEAGPDAYFRIMEAMADSLAACLGGT